MAAERSTTYASNIKIVYLKPIIDGISVIWLEILTFSALALIAYAPPGLTKGCTSLLMAISFLPLRLVIWLGLQPIIFTLGPYYTSIVHSHAFILATKLLYYVPYTAFYIVYLAFLLQGAMIIYYSLSGLVIVTYDFLSSPSLTTFPAASFRDFNPHMLASDVFSKGAGIRGFNTDDSSAEMPSSPDGTTPHHHDQTALALNQDSVAGSRDLTRRDVISSVVAEGDTNLDTAAPEHAVEAIERKHPQLSFAVLPADVVFAATNNILLVEGKRGRSPDLAGPKTGEKRAAGEKGGLRKRRCPSGGREDDSGGERIASVVDVEGRVIIEEEI